MNPLQHLTGVRNKIESYVVEQKSRDEYAEVHTPFSLVEEMVDKIPTQWDNPNETLLDPCAGIGQFPLVACERFMKGLENKIPDETERYRHIMENQIFMIDIQPKNCIELEKNFNPTRDLNLNIKCVDSLDLKTEEMNITDWKTRRFGTVYSGMDDLFGLGPKPEEYEALEAFKRVVKDKDEPEWIIKKFENGYI